MVTFKRCTEERYNEMLGVLPPALWIAKGFLVGEPTTHRLCNVTGAVTATYAAFIEYEGRFYEGPDMTFAEFKRYDLNNLPDGW